MKIPMGWEGFFSVRKLERFGLEVQAGQVNFNMLEDFFGVLKSLGATVQTWENASCGSPMNAQPIKWRMNQWQEALRTTGRAGIACPPFIPTPVYLFLYISVSNQSNQWTMPWDLTTCRLHRLIISEVVHQTINHEQLWTIPWSNSRAWRGINKSWHRKVPKNR